MTRDAAHGKITAQRTTRRPQNSLVRNWASPRLTRIVRATTATTHTTVLARTVGRLSLWSTLVKLDSPALPRRSPVIEYFDSEARTSSTAGQNTTPAMRARAGPSHRRAVQPETRPLLPTRGVRPRRRAG